MNKNEINLQDMCRERIPEKVEEIESMCKKMTRVQADFLRGKYLLEHYYSLREKRDFSRPERRTVDKIKDKLYDSIERYAYQQVDVQSNGYRLDSDAKDEMMDNITHMFFKKLPDYDPTKTTPTTFFRPYILEVIREYIAERVLHMEQRDFVKLEKINKAKVKCEKEGILEPDVELLSRMTKMPVKTVKRIIREEANSVYYDISDYMEGEETMPSPLDICLENERVEEMDRILSEELTPEDADFFCTYANFEGWDRLTYKELAKLFNISEHEAKSRIRRISETLVMAFDKSEVFRKRNL